MFNAIETRERLEEDAVEHGNDLPPEPEHLDEKISHMWVLITKSKHVPQSNEI